MVPPLGGGAPPPSCPFAPQKWLFVVLKKSCPPNFLWRFYPGALVGHPPPCVLVSSPPVFARGPPRPFGGAGIWVLLPRFSRVGALPPGPGKGRPPYPPPGRKSQPFSGDLFALSKIPTRSIRPSEEHLFPPGVLTPRTFVNPGTTGNYPGAKGLFSWPSGSDPPAGPIRHHRLPRSSFSGEGRPGPLPLAKLTYPNPVPLT